MSYPSFWSHSYTLTAGESDPGGEMPLTLVTERIIETATEHANALNIGYDELSKARIGWVLSRLAIEIIRYPRINERYTLTTWIESYNRHFSERVFILTAQDSGEVLGHMRSVWTAIDFEKRTIADLSEFEKERFPIPDRRCPIGPVKRPPLLPEEAKVSEYTFKYCDLDCNRHVNTVRYVALILNHWPLAHFDSHTVSRFDILFLHECLFGDTVMLKIRDTSPGISVCEIARTVDGRRAIAAEINWAPQ